jgi:hypothetical protein
MSPLWRTKNAKVGNPNRLSELRLRRPTIRHLNAAGAGAEIVIGMAGATAVHLLLFIAILGGNIILGHLMRANFPFVGVRGVLHALQHPGLERISFFE